MAWDLWCSSYDQVVHDDSVSEPPGWQCDFYFGCGLDVMEEDALNEKSCVQVLRILITKADTEIEELEKYLLSLQNELAWTEREKWPEVCCSVLNEKINCLDVSIRSLKNDCADGNEVQLLLHRNPAETLTEILRALQREYRQDENDLPLDVNILNPSANTSKHAVDKDSSNINLNILIKKEGKHLCGASGNSRSSKFVLELHEEKSDIESANTNVKASLKVEAGHPTKEKILAYNLDGNEEEETKEHISTAEERLLVENNSLGPEEKRVNPKVIKLSNVDVKNTSKDASKDANNLSMEKKQSSIPNRTISLELKEDNSTLVSDSVNPCLVLKHKEERLDLSKRAKELLGDFSCAAGHSDEKKIPGTSNLKDAGSEEVRRSQPIATDTARFLNCFSSKGKGNNIPRDDKQDNAIVRNASADACGHGTGMKGGKQCLDSRLVDSQEANSGKLCDLASTPVRRDCKKELEDAPAEEMEHMSSASKMEHKRKTTLQFVNTLELCRNSRSSPHTMNLKNVNLIHAENSAMTSLLEMQNKRAFCSGSQLADGDFKSEIGANISKSNVSSLKPKNDRKRKHELDALFPRETGDSPMEVISNVSLTVTSKRQWKSRTIIDGASLNESLNGKIAKRAVQPGQNENGELAIVPYETSINKASLHESPNRKLAKSAVQSGLHESKELAIVPHDAGIDGGYLNEFLNRKNTERTVQPGQHEIKELAIVPYDSSRSTSELPKKRKVSKLPITLEIKNSTVSMDLQKSERFAMDNGNQKSLQSSRLYSLVGSHNDETSAPVRWKDLKLSNLRAIAKQHNVRKYYNLTKGALVECLVTKGALVELLVNQLSSC